MTDAVRPSELDPKVAARLKRDSAGLMAAIAGASDDGRTASFVAASLLVIPPILRSRRSPTATGLTGRESAW